MALQGPFFGKRDEPTSPRGPGSTPLSGTSALGSAEIDIAEVRGSFDGNLTVRQKLVIFATGKVTGKIRYGKIVIEEGGQLSGEISFGTDKDHKSDKPAASAGSSKGEQLAVA